MGDESLTPAVTPTGAVFLSYASQDAEAAQCICLALRAAGVEVWFDQSELRGGDAWDQSIRKQIKTCAVFLPVISRNTHDRDEGYFRLEWKLAVDRSHLMAADKAFLLPVVVDETRDDDERVPDRFREVQWTRLPAGKTPPEFARRIRQLLSGEPRPSMAGATAPAATSSSRSWRLKFVWLAVAVPLVAVAAYVLAEKPWVAKSTAFAPPAHSIAVLPFVNMSGDKGQEYFSDGLTEEVLNSLAEINELQVAARTSAFSFKGKDADIGTIARALNVGAVLEGSVRRSGTTVRVTTQLINAVTGFHLWSHTFDRDLGDVLKLESDIAGAVANALKVRLLGDAAAKIELGGTRNPTAFDAYLRASKAFSSASEEKGFREAVAAYTEAINLDGGYARAYAGRSRALRSEEEEEGTDDLLEKARSDARQAIVLAPELADGHVALAGFYMSTLDIAGAQDEIKRAAVLAPGNVETLRSYGVFLTLLGHGDEAVSVLRRALSLDPLNVQIYMSLGETLGTVRHYEEAIATYREALTLEPGRLGASLRIGFDWYELGNFDSARSACEPKRDYWLAQMCLALVYEKLGRHSDAEAMLARVRSKFGDAGAYGYTYAYAQWQNIPEALKWLDTAFRLHDNDLLWMKTDPLMDPLRREPRFQAIIRELKFPD